MGWPVDTINTSRHSERMASIQLRTSLSGIVTHVVLFRVGKKQTSETFETDKGAQEFKRLVEAHGGAEARAILDDREDTAEDVPTLAEWCERYITQLTGVTDGTRKRYRSLAAKRLGPLAARPVDAITAEHVGAWVNAQEKEGLSGKTIAVRHGFLSGAMKGAIRRGHAKSNPCEGTRLPQTERVEMVFLSPAEFARLLPYIRQDAVDLVSILPATGLRWSEATALRAGDIDLTRGLVTVSRAWKWDGTNQPKAGPPKSWRSRRTIPLPSQAVDIFRRLVEGLAPDEYIFTNPKGEPWGASAFHSVVWQPAVRRANGLPGRPSRSTAPERTRKDGKPWGVRRDTEPVAAPGEELGKTPRVHDMRHTCAAWMIAAGVPLAVIQRHLGHESITTTIDRYGHLEPEHLAVAATALSSALEGALPRG